MDQFIFIAVHTAAEGPYLVVPRKVDTALLFFKSFAGKFQSQNHADGGCIYCSAAFPLSGVLARHHLIGQLQDIFL